MKFFVILFTTLASFSALAADLTMTPTVVPAAYKNLYIPGGFDSNDTVQFAADGLFTNACYKIAPPKVSVDETRFAIVVEAQAYLYSGMCAMVMIPFQQVIQVGIIKTAGRYSILDSAGVLIGQVEVKAATSALEDDYLYAPVQKLSVDQTLGNKLVLKGEFASSCMKMKEVRIVKEPNVIVVLPIVEVAADTANCETGSFPWTEEVDLGPLQQKRYLIHVRTSGSQALNEILVN